MVQDAMEHKEHQKAGQLTPGLGRSLVRRLIVSAIRIIVVAYLGAILMGCCWQDRLIFYPSKTIRQTPVEGGLRFEEVTLKTSDGVTLSAWYVPAAQKGSRTMVFCHGNAGNIGDRLDKLAIFHSLDTNTLIFDYRGYGTSDGKPSEPGTYLDAQAAYDWLHDTRGVPSADIIIYGESLGGAVAANLASQRQCRGLILDSTFTSVADVGARAFPLLPVRLMVGRKYDTTAVIAKVRCPVLMIHSRNDEIVPFELGQKLFGQANEPKAFVEIAGGHNDGFAVSEEAYTKALRLWLASMD
jgi:uncharacterized protein